MLNCSGEYHMAMLLDKYLPEYDVTEVHIIRIRAAPEMVYNALMGLSVTEISNIVRFLFWLRALPEKPATKKLVQLNYSKPFLKTMLDNGFTALAAKPPDEFVFGMIAPGNIGRFWKKAAMKNVSLKDAQSFMAFNDPDYIRVVANFSITAADKPGRVILRTESRSKGLSKKTFKQFRPYWTVIRPWSGLIRRL
jgi:hypothetical protein